MQTEVATKVNRSRAIRRIALFSVPVVTLSIALGGWTLLNQQKIERELDRALILKQYSGRVAPEGTNILQALGSDAIPTLLRWSSGKQPFWHKIVNPIRQKLNQPPLTEDISSNKEKARAGFFFLREQAVPAVPILLGRLSDTNVETRRFSVQMLGAIGPAMGAEAFNQMTSCLTDPEDNVRNDVIWAFQFHRLSEYPPEMLIPVFLTGLKDTNKVARQNAMVGLLRMGTNAVSAKAAIEDALNDSDAGVKSLAQSWMKGKYPHP